MSTRLPSRTVFLALAVLDDAIVRCGLTGPLRREKAVRLALTILYEASGGAGREPFDELWRTLIGLGEVHKESFRQTWAGTQFAIICRSVGVPQDIALTRALARARRNRG